MSCSCSWPRGAWARPPRPRPRGWSRQWRRERGTSSDPRGRRLRCRCRDTIGAVSPPGSRTLLGCAHPSGGSVELTANYRWGFTMKEDEITGAKGLLSQSAGSGLLSTNTIWWICYCILACRDILKGKCCYLLKVISTLEQFFFPLFERGLKMCALV